MEKVIKGEAMAASSTDLQQAFLKAMGLIAPEVIQFENVLSEEIATILSNALNHIVVEEDLSDPFFTPEEWEKVQKARKTILDKFIEERYSSLKVKNAPNVFVLTVSKV